MVAGQDGAQILLRGGWKPAEEECTVVGFRLVDEDRLGHRQQAVRVGDQLARFLERVAREDEAAFDVPSVWRGPGSDGLDR